MLLMLKTHVVGTRTTSLLCCYLLKLVEVLLPDQKRNPAYRTYVGIIKRLRPGRPRSDIFRTCQNRFLRRSIALAWHRNH